MNNILSILAFLPLMAIPVVLVLPKGQEKAMKLTGIVVTGIQLLLSIYVYVTFQTGAGSPVGIDSVDQFQFVERLQWFYVTLEKFGDISANYFFGVDGISITLVLLSGIVMFVGAIASWNIQKQVKGFFALYLLLSTAVFGCFIALDMLLFYVFFEFMLLPLYFLIGIWGGKRKEYAAIKFFLYTLFGSIFILLVMIALYTSVVDPMLVAVKLNFATTIDQVTPAMVAHVQAMIQAGNLPTEAVVHTFDMVAMADSKNYLPDSILYPVLTNPVCASQITPRELAFLALFIGFAIKLPVVPFHTWLPDAHVQAPTSVSVVFAGILLKVGGYGLLRMAYTFFPVESSNYATIIAILGMISILWGAYNALAMNDLKKLVAYSSVSHMGFILLGVASITSEGISGALYQMFSHGILSAMLFIIVGVLYDRTDNRMIDSYKGLAVKMPYYTAVVTIAFFASLGLPGFSAFIAEIFVFLGAFSGATYPKWIVIVSLLGIVLSAAYFLWALQRIFFGKLWLKDESWKGALKDLTPREYIMLVPICGLTLLFGIAPHYIFNWVAPTVNHFVDFLTR